MWEAARIAGILIPVGEQAKETRRRTFASTCRHHERGHPARPGQLTDDSNDKDCTQQDSNTREPSPHQEKKVYIR